MSLERYFASAASLLQALQTQTPALQTAATWIAEAIVQDRLLYTFGTGHSHSVAAELFHRAGGLAPVSLMAEASSTFAVGANVATLLERTPGLGQLIAQRYPIQSGDVLLVVSTSAANAVPLEVAQSAKAQGAKVIALLSLEYARFKNSPMLQIADLLLDNYTGVGDAAVQLGESPAGSLSTLSGIYMVNALVCEVAALLSARGVQPPLYQSSNLPTAHAHNSSLTDNLWGRIRNL